MSLTQDQIKRLQKLTAIAREGDLDISGVLDSFESLKNGELVLPSTSSRSGEGVLHPRPDTVHSSVASRDELLGCSPQRIAAHQITLSSIMIGE